MHGNNQILSHSIFSKKLHFTMKAFSFFVVLVLFPNASPSPSSSTRHIRHPTRRHIEHRGHHHSATGNTATVNDSKTILNVRNTKTKTHHMRDSSPGVFKFKDISNIALRTSKVEASGVLVKGSVVVEKNGGGNFKTIGEALAVAPSNLNAGDGYFVIYIKAGVYEEYVTVPENAKYVMFVGDGINATAITGDRNAAHGWASVLSATVTIEGDGFVASGVTFRNTAGLYNKQAVALRCKANHSTFFRCSIEGYQDTLFVESGQQFYRECTIYGTIDFIYGNAVTVFQKCTILARRPVHGQQNMVTAQGREDPSIFSAFVLQNCTVDAAPDLLADPSPARARTYLGRPWKPYATVAVMQSFLGATVAPAGWYEFKGSVGLSTLCYGEYGNYGPGADTRQRVQWPGFSVMNTSQAARFTVANMMQRDTWLPQTKIPFFSGLIVS